MSGRGAKKGHALVATAAVLAFAGVFTSTWVLNAVADTDPVTVGAPANAAAVQALGVQLLANAFGFNVVFWGVTTISTYKPWGKLPTAGSVRPR